MLNWNNATKIVAEKRTEQSQHFLKTRAFGHPFRPKLDRFNMAHNLFPIFNEFRTNVNAPYIFCCLSRVLITFAGSFNGINYTKNAHFSTWRSDPHSQYITETTPNLVSSAFPLPTSVHFLTVHYILINAYQHVLPNPFTSESEVTILHRSATHQAFEGNIYLK